jgi:hypothetical protein
MKTPREYQEDKDQFTAMYARASEELEEVLARKPAVWMQLREQSKSAAEADIKWSATEDGIQEMRLKLRLKRYEKEISAASTALRVLDTEARNLT